MRTFRFLDFVVYKEAKVFYKEIIFLVRRFPREYWELADQMRRSSLSVCLNVAEGSAKRTDKDFNRYIENALGSINEAVAGLDIALSESLVNKALFENYITKAETIAKQLGGFSKKLRSSKPI
ncbi:MAG: four helix bundle protein [Patescibacteria group bacterium]